MDAWVRSYGPFGVSTFCFECLGGHKNVQIFLSFQLSMIWGWKFCGLRDQYSSFA